MEDPQESPLTGVAEAQVQEPGQEKSNIAKLREKLGDRADEVLERIAGTIFNGVIWLEKKRFGPEGGNLTQLEKVFTDFAEDITHAAVGAVTFGMKIPESGPTQSKPETPLISQQGTGEGPQT